MSFQCQIFPNIVDIYLANLENQRLKNALNMGNNLRVQKFNLLFALGKRLVDEGKYVRMNNTKRNYYGRFNSFSLKEGKEKCNLLLFNKGRDQ